MSLRTLVVDDDAGFAHSLADLVSDCGHRAEVLTSGQAALNQFRRDQAFSLAFVDVHMPGVHGLRVARLVKRLGLNCDIHLMTALNLKDALSPVVSEGSIEVLENPYRTEQLLETFTSILPAGIAIVVNDDRDAGMRIARILSRKGYAVRVGTPDRDVIFGIRALRCSALVLDLDVPVVHALDRYATVREDPPGVPTVIVLRAAAVAAGETDLLRSPRSTGLLFKPFDVEPILKSRALRH